MAHNRASDVEDLISLARDKSQQGRSELFSAISDLYSGENRILTETDRALMTDIMRSLIKDVEKVVRRTLADQLAEQPDAPSELVVLLANDEIEVAHSILVKSEVLRDAELIEIIQQRAMEHHLAIASRHIVSEPVSDALVTTKNENVIERVLFNPGAALSAETMDHLVEQSRTVSRYQEPLVHRQDISPQLAKKLYWGVSAALRKYIVENFEIDPNDLDETIETAVKGAFGEKCELPCQDAKEGVRESTEDAQDSYGLVKMIRDGNIVEFIDKFTSLSGLRLGLVRRILFEQGGESLAIVCKAISVDMHTFSAIFVLIRPGRLGYKQVDPEEVSNAVSFYDQTDVNSAKALLRHWQRDPGYLNALRLVDQI